MLQICKTEIPYVSFNVLLTKYNQNYNCILIQNHNTNTNNTNRDEK